MLLEKLTKYQGATINSMKREWVPGEKRFDRKLHFEDFRILYHCISKDLSMAGVRQLVHIFLNKA